MNASFGQTPTERLEPLDRRDAGRTRHDEHELLSTVTAGHIAPLQESLKQDGKRAEHEVTGTMTVPVVAVAEMIQVEHRDGQRPPLTPHMTQLAGKLLLHEATVVQPGERVTNREAAEFFPLTHVPEATRRRFRDGSIEDGPSAAVPCQGTGRECLGLRNRPARLQVESQPPQAGILFADERGVVDGRRRGGAISRPW